MPPWEKYQTTAPAPVAASPAAGPWTKFHPPATSEPEWREPGMIVPVQFNTDGGARWAVPQMVTELIKAVEAPGKALRGDYGLEIDTATGRPTPITNEMIGDTMGTAGLALTPLSPAASAGAKFGSSIMKPSAQRVIQRELDNAGIPLSEVGPRLAGIGDGAVIADLTPGLQARAAAIATMSGAGQKTVVDALAARRAGSNARIISEVDGTIGPAPIPTQMAADNLAAKKALGPRYDALFDGRVRAVDSSDLALDLDSLIVNERGGAQSAAKKVRDMINVTGNKDQLDPNPYTLFRTRNAIDGMLAGETDTGAIAVLTRARKQIDDLLAPAVPGLKELDAQYAELARQGDAIQTGQQLLDTGRTAPRPADVDQMMGSGAVPQGTLIGPSAVPLRLREGARAEIDRIIGTNIRDITAMRRIVAGEGNWNRDKLASVFGAEKAAKLLAIFEREALFDATEQLALQGSRTQVLRAAQDDIMGAGPKANPFRSAANFRFGDAVADAADRSLSWISQGRRSASNQQVAEALMAQISDTPMVSAVSQRPPSVGQGSYLNIVRALALQQ